MIGESFAPANQRSSTEDTTSIWTPAVFKGINVDGIRMGGVDGVLIEKFFNRGFKPSTNINAAEAYWEDGWMVFGDGGAQINAVAGLGLAGGVKIYSDGDNEGASIRHQFAPFKLARSRKAFGFEVVLSTDTIADTKHGFFAGLIEDVAATAIIPLTALGALADKNLVGFHRLEGDGDYVNCVYKANGVAAVTVKEDAHVLVADTDIRLGMRYSPAEDFNKSGRYWLRFFANGRLIASAEKQIPSTDGDDFPNDIGLGIILSVLNATATTPGATTFKRVMAAQEL